MNPMDEFLSECLGEKIAEEKDASFYGDATHAAGRGLAHGAAAMALTGAVVGAQHMLNAATKSRDFRSMLMHNQDLAQHEDPNSVSMAFTTLRRFSPQFSKDPLVAGTYVRRIVENPTGAGGIIGEAMGHTQRTEHPLMEQGFMGMQAGIKPPGSRSDPNSRPPRQGP